MSWVQEAAEPAALTCPASATTPAVPPAPHLHCAVGIVLVFGYLVQIPQQTFWSAGRHLLL